MAAKGNSKDESAKTVSRLEGEKARNKAAKNSDLYSDRRDKAKSLLNSRDQRIEEDVREGSSLKRVVFKNSDRGREVMRQGLAGAGRFGNLTARQESALRRAKRAALKKMMNKKDKK